MLRAGVLLVSRPQSSHLAADLAVAMPGDVVRAQLRRSWGLTEPSLIISGAPLLVHSRQAVILLDGIGETELVSGSPVYVFYRGNAGDSDNYGQVRYFSLVSGSNAIAAAMEKAAQQK